MNPVRKYEWRDAGRETKVALVEQAYGSSPILYVTTTILVHELTPAAAAALADVKLGAALDDAPERNPCPCCGSVYATITERRPDLALFIDRDTGSRVDASRLTPAERAQLEADAEPVEILLRVSRAQLPLLLAPARRHIMASGSMRAGKTQVGAYWLVRQILIHGGRKAQFWIIGETEYDAFRVLQKMLYGDDKAPAILPPVLFTYVPGTERMSLLCKMVDGTLLDLKHLRDPSGGNLKREAVQAILVDEAAEIRTLDQFNTIEGRTITTHARQPRRAILLHFRGALLALALTPHRLAVPGRRGLAALLAAGARLRGRAGVPGTRALAGLRAALRVSGAVLGGRVGVGRARGGRPRVLVVVAAGELRQGDGGEDEGGGAREILSGLLSLHCLFSVSVWSGDCVSGVRLARPLLEALGFGEFMQALERGQVARNLAADRGVHECKEVAIQVAGFGRDILREVVGHGAHEPVQRHEVGIGDDLRHDGYCSPAVRTLSSM